MSDMGDGDLGDGGTPRDEPAPAIAGRPYATPHHLLAAGRTREEDYPAAWARWRENPEAYWLEAATLLDWDRFPSRAHDPAPAPFGAWFGDGLGNTCHNALDRHVAAGRGSVTAIVHDSPVTGAVRRLTYAELLAEVVALAAVMRDLGVVEGDRVIVSMPMIPEALVAMLACARLGAVHSVVFGGFAARELGARIEDSGCKVVLAASCGVEGARVVPYGPLIAGAIEASTHRPDAVVMLQRPMLAAEPVPGLSRDWDALVGAAKAAGRTVAPVPVPGTAPLYVLYTSGTTGRPKGVVREAGGHMVSLAWSLRAIYDARMGDTYWCASDVGWVVGHSYIVYAPLLMGLTTVVYEGKPVGTPDASAYWRVVEEHGVNVLFTAPTALRAIRREDPGAEHLAGRDLARFRALFLAGERADPETVAWAEGALGRPVIDHWWQTETGWPICANPLGLAGGLPVKRGSPTVPMPGWDLVQLDAAGAVVAPGMHDPDDVGSLAIRLPLPPGAARELWNDPGGARYASAYLGAFPGHYTTADAGSIDAEGYALVMGRTDDVINVAGHRLSTGALEEALAAHPLVAECAVVGAADALKGEAPLGFVVLKAGAGEGEDPAALHARVEAELVALVRERIGPVASFRRAVVVARLPKTRSGKVLRGAMKRLADGGEANPPPTIEDVGALHEVAAALGRG